MNLKTIAAAALLATAAATSFAAPVSLGDVTNMGNFSLPTLTGLKGSFSDAFTFNLTNTAEVSDSLTSTFTKTNTGEIYNFAATLTGPNGYNQAESLSTMGKMETVSFDFPSLSTGLYTLTITGNVKNGSGTINGVMGVSPVPEPASIALLLAGLGCMGFVAKRRKQG